jgi:CRISPR-associated protein Csd1
MPNSTRWSNPVLKELVAAAARFQGLPPRGYSELEIRWVLDIAPDGTSASLVPFEKGLRKAVPVRGDRSGEVSEDNMKAALLVDRASYALGMQKDGTISDTRLEFQGFRRLLEEFGAPGHDAEISNILAFLKRLHTERSGMALQLQSEIQKNVKPNQLIALRSQGRTFPFESPRAQSFWQTHLISESKRPQDAPCGCCGASGPILRILTFQVSLLKYSFPISSANKDAFNSFGRNQTANSPLCFSCAADSTRVLQYLLDSERNHRILTRDEGDKTPLRNCWAVFWTNESETSSENFESIDLETCFASPLSPPDSPPPDPQQMKRLYGLPFSSSGAALQLDEKRFYVAVVSPNKSRLVVREWIDESAARIVETLSLYNDARTICTADGHGEWRPDIPALLNCLKPWKSASAWTDANLLRTLLRTAYQGQSPPVKLLESAVLRFRVPDHPLEHEKEEALQREQTLISAIKFVLTYAKKEAVTLQSLDKSSKSTAYLCGRLLAVLEEAQGRASRWRVQATIVDRFYGGASTSPKNTLGILVRQGTVAHMPKIRKMGAGYRDLEETLESVMVSIDDGGGFPPTLTLREQGEFALGFYHQRANFSAGRPPRNASSEGKAK